ncbi:MAG: DUF177 domain-containing protein [Capnocytophaga sp.]|nr:DUF177 domain-containing protein [Capnocytophaga sp.]
MRKLREYDISFAGLKQGKHQFSYEVGKKFLELFDYDEFNDLQQTIEITLDKKSTLLELHFVNKGTVNVNCDLTNEPFDLQTESEWLLVVKFGEAYNDDNEALLILPHGEYQLNVAQYIYELIVLSVPAKRIHPEVEKGNFHPEIMQQLDALSPKDLTDIEEAPEHETDPRWNELKKLINNGKDK